MSEEILVNVTPRETRVAVIENGMLQELHIERGWRRGVVGNIYKGKVQRVMPGMQAAFVEVGLERAAFLHANDVVRLAPAPASVVDTEETRSRRRRRRRCRSWSCCATARRSWCRWSRIRSAPRVRG